MKKLIGFALAFLLFASPLFAADTAMDSFTDDSASPVGTDYLVGYSGTSPYRWTIASIMGLNAATATALASNPTDCSANNFATAIAASGNLTCAQPTPANLGNGTLASTMTVGTGGSVAASGTGTITATNIVAGSGTASIAGPTTARILTVDDAAQTLAARNTANTFTENNTFGNADTDTLTIRSLIVGGNSRAVWIAGSAPTPSYATGTNELYVAGDIETAGNLYAAGITSTAATGGLITMTNTAEGRIPSAGEYGIWFETDTTDQLKYSINGTEKAVVNTADNQTIAGTKTFTGAQYFGDASNAGAIRIYDGSSNYWLIQPQAMSGDYTMVLPTTAGSTGQYLKTTVSGSTATLSWDTPSAAAAGSDTQVQFNDGGAALGGDAGFVYNKTTDTLTLGENGVDGALKLYNDLGGGDGSVTISPNSGQTASSDIVITLPAATSTLATLGANTFTGDQALGANNLTMTGYIAIGADPADAGNIRLPNAGSIVWEDGTEASITHVDNTGWLLNGAMALQFGDSGTYINQSADGTLAVVGDTHVKILINDEDLDISKTGSNGITIGTNTGVTKITTALSLDMGTSAVLSTGTIELGAASDTTIARSAAGVITVEGVTVTRTIASGSVTSDQGSLASGACTSAIDGGTATGTATTDVISWNFNGDPTGITGYAASANGGLFIYAYPTADHVNFKVCNNTAEAINAGSITLNWKVFR